MRGIVLLLSAAATGCLPTFGVEPDDGGPPLDAYAREVFADAPTAYWRLDETSNATLAHDASANALHLVRESGVAFGATGVTGTLRAASFQFGGLEQEDSSAGDPLDLDGSFTLEAWVRPVQLSGMTAHRIIERMSYGEPRVGYTLHARQEPAGGLELFTPAQQPTLMGVQLELDRWTHVVATYDEESGDTQLYIDGIEDNYSKATGHFSTATPLSIARSSEGSDHFAGSLDEIAIYRRALPAARVRAHFDAAQP